MDVLNVQFAFDTVENSGYRSKHLLKVDDSVELLAYSARGDNPAF